MTFELSTSSAFNSSGVNVANWPRPYSYPLTISRLSISPRRFRDHAAVARSEWRPDSVRRQGCHFLPGTAVPTESLQTLRWREMDSNFQFRARRAGVLTGLYRRRPSKVFAFPPKRPVSCTRDRWFESVSLQRRVGRTSHIRPAAPAIEIEFAGKARVAADTAASPKRVAPRSRASNGVRNHDGRSCNCAWQRRAQPAQ